MQRKIGYGLIGASLTILLLLGIGFVWQAVVPATATETESAVSNSSPDISPAIISNEPVEQNEQLLVSEPVTPTPIPTLSQTESLVLIEPEATPFILPQETDDATIILASLQYLADREQEKWSKETEGWYHLKTMSWWPQGDGVFRGQNNDQEITTESSTILATSNIHETYLHYTADGLFVEGMTLTRHPETGEIQQISLLADDEWTNVSLHNLGFGEDVSRVPANDFSAYFPVQEILEGHTSLWQQMREQVTMYAYLKEGQYVVHLTLEFAEPIQAAGASGLHQAVEYVVSFDTESGYFVSEVYGQLVDGGQEKMASHTILSQAFLATLPDDIEKIYQENLSK